MIANKWRQSLFGLHDYDHFIQCGVDAISLVKEPFKRNPSRFNKKIYVLKKRGLRLLPT